jgi:gliding motility-associated-like protein
MSFDPNPDHIYMQTGTYPVQVTVTNTAGCRDTASSMVSVFPQPVSDFSTANGVTKIYADYQEVEFTNLSQGAVSYQWNFGNGNTSAVFEPELIYNDPGLYNVTLEVVNNKGCRHVSAKRIEVIVPENVFIPNAFTPNDDFKNDLFTVKFQNIVQAHISIYNRWGELIYSTDNMDFEWDGKINGRTVQNDVYVYLIDAIGYYGDIIRKTGKITVLF